MNDYPKVIVSVVVCLLLTCFNHAAKSTERYLAGEFPPGSVNRNMQIYDRTELDQQLSELIENFKKEGSYANRVGKQGLMELIIYF